MNGHTVERLRRGVASQLAKEFPVGREGPSPSVDAQRRRAEILLKEQLDLYARERFSREGLALEPEDEESLGQAVLNNLFGLGRLQRLLNDPLVENININGADAVWIKKLGDAKHRVEPVADSDEELIELIQHAAAHLGPTERSFNSGRPQLDLQLPGGHRLSAVMGVCSRPAVSIRRHRLLSEEQASLDELVALGAIDRGLKEFLKAAVRARKTMIIAGGTNAGKTTLVRALANEIPSQERLITIEKSLELSLDTVPRLHPDVVALEAREPNTEGEGAVSMSSLVRRALRMDPDRVIVGEVLGDEVIDMLNAMSQGNDGSLCTMHANSSEAVFRRLCTYAIQAPERLAPEATNLLTAGAITFVVFIAMVNEQGQKYRNEGGGLLRFVHSIREVVGAQGLEVHSREVFRPGGDGRAVPGDPIGCLADLVRNGYDPRNFEQKEGFWQ